MPHSEILCNGSWKTGKSDHFKDTLPHNAGRNDCKPLSYYSTLGSRPKSVPEFFGSNVQSSVKNCSPGTPLLLVFPMPQAKTKYQRSQETTNFRLDAKTRFLVAAKDPTQAEDISALIQAQACQKTLPTATWQVDWPKLSLTSPKLGSALKKRKLKWMSCLHWQLEALVK